MRSALEHGHGWPVRRRGQASAGPASGGGRLRVMVPAHSHSREATRAGRRGVLFEIKL